MTGVKALAGIATESLAIQAETLDSLTDVIYAALSRGTARASVKPADREHMYGHEKIERVVVLVEVVILIEMTAFIVYESVLRMLSPARIAFEDVGIVVMRSTALSDLFLAIYNYRGALSLRSPMSLEG